MSTATVEQDRHRFHPLRVARVIPETRDACSLVFDVPGALQPLFAYQAGQFLTLEVPCGEGAPLKRCYSLASSPACDPDVKVTVKRVAGGRASNWINDRVREGDTLPVLAPAGRFVLPREDASLLLFAGGSGITPVLSLAKTALHTRRGRVRLVYANRDEASIIFREELEALVRRFPDRLRVAHRLDERDGLMTAADVARFIDDPFGHAFLCGPRPFMDLVEAALIDEGMQPEHVHLERFESLPDPKPVVSGTATAAGAGEAAAPLPTGAAEASPGAQSGECEVVLRIGRDEHVVRCKPNQTILQAAQAAGIDPPSSCEEGLCGACIAGLVEGAVEMPSQTVLSPSEKQRGLILPCCSKPKSARAVVDFSLG